ncbi:CatB-related O-acetyltransferase [Mucilaginibacter corticis]|uniref:CatB-related O-acetyltransferase n=2 Tax=Mucilaginibacter corticis TaxID=2597670 RepID=A0A556MXG5_9SPHI|nr:CatB-related O-acetyltransferase [Mucilaginibacter corticis]
MVFYKPYIYFKYKAKVSASAVLSRSTFLSENCTIHSKVVVANSSIGYGTYIGQKSKLANTHVGAYCSIANNVEVLPYTHPSSTFVSTHPAFFSVLKQAGFTYTTQQLFNEELFFDREKKIHLKIGNDVWIGTNVLIMGGIEIGDGAIIAAGSVVTKNVKAFDIVGGVPAKVINSRFNAEQIELLNKIQWWNRSPEWIKQNSELFKDIQVFEKAIEKSHPIV